MIKWLFLIPVVGIPLIFLNINGLSNDELNHNSEIDTSILQIGEDFIKKMSLENSTDERVLGTLRDITEAEILEEAKLPDLEIGEKIVNNGLRLSTNYNQIHYDYSMSKLTDTEYFLQLLDFRIKYEKYMTAIDSYVGSDNILPQKNSMMKELQEITHQIQIFESSKTFDSDWEQTSQYDKYKKFLPSMFSP